MDRPQGPSLPPGSGITKLTERSRLSEVTLPPVFQYTGGETKACGREGPMVRPGQARTGLLVPWTWDNLVPLTISQTTPAFSSHALGLPIPLLSGVGDETPDLPAGG